MEQFKYGSILIFGAVILFFPMCFGITYLSTFFLAQEGNSQFVMGSGLVVCITIPVAFFLSYIAMWMLGFLFLKKESVEKLKHKQSKLWWQSMSFHLLVFPFLWIALIFIFTATCNYLIQLHVYLGFSDWSRWDNTGLGIICFVSAFCLIASIVFLYQNYKCTNSTAK
jgi:hypothetical protein